MERPPNAVSILSTDPFVAEVSDCLACGAEVPAGTPWYENGSGRATARYRLCRSCVAESLYAHLMGGLARERVQAKLTARLRLIGDALEDRSARLAAMQVGSVQ